MKVIKNSLAKKYILTDDKFDNIFRGVSSYLSESSVCSVKLNYSTKTNYEAVVNILDGKVNVASTQYSDNPLSAINLAVNNCVQQLSKLKGKNLAIEKKSIRYVDKDIKLQNPLLDQLKILKYERYLECLRQTDNYQCVLNRYLEYLYLDYDIERAESQLSVLYSILENVNYETIPYAEMLRLIESIELLSDEINFMLTEKRKFETNSKHQRNTNKIIKEEVKLLDLKRKCNL